MPKTITSYVCQECGYDSAQYLGKCPECGAWNSFKEFKTQKSNLKSIGSSLLIDHTNTTPKNLSQITATEKQRIQTGFVELDTVLGGGLVKGSAVLLAGDPGIGKSTILLQTAMNIASQSSVLGSQLSEKGQSDGQSTSQLKTGKLNSENRKQKTDTWKSIRDSSATPQNDKREIASSQNASRNDNGGGIDVLYVSAEESEEQIKLRATRITSTTSIKGTTGTTGNIDNLLILSTSDTDAIVSIIQERKPGLVIIDSIQTVQSAHVDSFAGSVAQIRYGAASFIKLAKSLGIPTIMVGHVTKEGMVAGPMLLSHMVDTVLFFEGEKLTKTRILRSLKNRFGPVDEVGVFSMEGEGISEVKNPEQIFLTQKKESTPGSVLTVMQEGSRAFLLEIQALVVYSKFPNPRRVASGVDTRRLELLLAVLQKHARLTFESCDGFGQCRGGG